MDILTPLVTIGLRSSCAPGLEAGSGTSEGSSFHGFWHWFWGSNPYPAHILSSVFTIQPYPTHPYFGTRGPQLQETAEACSAGLFEAFRVDLSADSTATWLVASMTLMGQMGQMGQMGICRSPNIVLRGKLRVMCSQVCFWRWKRSIWLRAPQTWSELSWVCLKISGELPKIHGLSSQFVIKELCWGPLPPFQSQMGPPMQAMSRCLMPWASWRTLFCCRRLLSMVERGPALMWSKQW